LEPDPDQFTSFRPPPSDVRRSLPYAANGSTVVIPSGWRLATQPPGVARPDQPARGSAIQSINSDPGLSIMFGLLFGGGTGDAKTDQPRTRAESNDSGHDHDPERARPPIRPVRRFNPPATKPDAIATVPPLPADAAVQAKIEKNLASLSAESRAAAQAQRVCIVKGELLGARGVPIRVKFKNRSGTKREVFVCCDDCEDELYDHPDKYWSRLKD
jgi:hypothetical protein